MIYVLIVALVGFLAMVLISLFRGLNAFRQSLDAEPGDTGVGATPLQLQQNRMMFARIKYQALAVGVVALLLMLAR